MIEAGGTVYELGKGYDSEQEIKAPRAGVFEQILFCMF